ncbi:MAG: T9SS type A sorting domain-containing protein [Bacteroidetes bacterium]|nr:T9SS type A sorting domain-containing protein [Bacteroidota bacterium]
MKKVSLFFAIILLFLIIPFAQGKSVDVPTARQVARNFIFEKCGKAYDRIQIEETLIRKSGDVPVYYTFNLANGGYVIVAADDHVVPVLAYSFDGKVGNTEQPPQFIAWMEGYEKQILDGMEKNYAADEAVVQLWKHLSVSDPSLLDTDKSTLDVAPLFTTTWDQGSYYNALCPEDAAGPGGHVWAGCVATAMSQVMYYYRYPQTGEGSHCYTPPNAWYGEQCADFGATTYEWNGMHNQLERHSNPTATLLYHAGVAVDMMYSPSGSGAYSEDAAAALRNNFLYCPGTQLYEKDNYTNSQWEQMLRDNLDAGKPMYYHGFGSGGHAFNVDGYQGTSYFHFNWGWSGSFNGYYYLSNLNPGGYNFTYGQGAILNQHPDTINNNYPSYCNGLTEINHLDGSIEDGSGPLRNYHNNMVCNFLINPTTPEDSIDFITLTFHRFDTELNNDIVTIYEGNSTANPILGTYSGSSLPPVITSYSSSILITFSSNGSITGKGWYATYHSHTLTWCSGTTHVTEETDTISDGSFNYNYKNATNCKWSIHPEGMGALTLFFLAFDTEAGNDKVKIYDTQSGTLLAEYSGTFTTDNMPAPVTAPSGKMFVMFTTNQSVTAQGWKAYYVCAPVTVEEQSPFTRLQVYPNPATDKIFVDLTTEKSDQITYTLLSLTGETLFSKKMDHQQGKIHESLDVSGISKGIYFLRISGSQGNMNQKVIIQ